MKTTSIIIETDKPFTGELLIGVLDHYPGAVVIVPPSILEEIILLGPSSIDTLVTAHRVMFVGAPLSVNIGEKLADAGVKLMTVFGT